MGLFGVTLADAAQSLNPAQILLLSFTLQKTQSQFGTTKTDPIHYTKMQSSLSESIVMAPTQSSVRN